LNILKLLKNKYILIALVITAIIYFNKDIRAIIALKLTGHSTDIWFESKKFSNKYEALMSKFKVEDETTILTDNTKKLNKLKKNYNQGNFKAIYLSLSENYRGIHTQENFESLFKNIKKQFGKISDFKLDSTNVEYDENSIKSREEYLSNFITGKGRMIFLFNLLDSTNSEILDLGFQLDNQISSKIFPQNKIRFLNLLKNKKYVELNEITTMNYKMENSLENFENLNNSISEIENLKPISTFIKLDVNDNSYINYILQDQNKNIISLGLTVESNNKIRISEFNILDRN